MTQSLFAGNIPAVLSSFSSSKMHYANRNSAFHYMLPTSTPFRTPVFQVFQLRHMKLLICIVIFREFLNIVEKAYKQKDKREIEMM